MNPENLIKKLPSAHNYEEMWATASQQLIKEREELDEMRSVIVLQSQAIKELTSALCRVSVLKDSTEVINALDPKHKQP